MARIYLSATRRDLAAECLAVKAWLEKAGHEAVDSYFPSSLRTLESCLLDLDGCDLYLLLQGHSYGDRPVENNPDDLSYTHLEYRRAWSRPRLVLRPQRVDDYRLTDIYKDDEFPRVKAFHAEVDTDDLRPATFTDENDLLEKLGRALQVELGRLGLAPAAAGLDEPLRRASCDLLAWATTLSDGQWLDRPELADLWQRIQETGASVTLLLGEPGCGKSALLARLGQKAQAADMPVLGIKADFLPENIVTQAALGEYLGLPRVPLAVIQTLAATRPVLVLLDQLDALADLLVQRPARLRVLLDFIRDLARLDNVHVVASCRVFEQRHDPSLRHLKAEVLTLALPSWEQVDAALRRHGVQAGGWNAAMRETLRSPQALVTFLDLLTGTQEPDLMRGFQGLLQTLWERKVLGVPGPRRDLLLDMARRMAEQETLSLPLAWYEDRYTTVRELMAEGLLSEAEGTGRLQFRHQTLFEFVRARSFLEEVSSLTRAVLTGQGSLRIRPQVWYALNLMRQVAPDRYQKELHSLWCPDLRPHLRMLLIEFLGMQPSPLPGEVALAWREFDDSWFQPRFLTAVVGSQGWFAQLATGHLPMLMAHPTAQAGAALPILSRALEFAVPEVLALLDRHWLPDPDKDVLSWRVLAMGNVAPQDATWVDRLVRIAARTNLAHWTVGHTASVVSAALPEEAPRLLAAWLRAQWHQAQSVVTPLIEAEGASSELSPYRASRDQPAIKLLESRDLHDLPAIAEAAPAAFIAAIWPLFLDMLETVLYEPHDFVVGYRGNSLMDDDPDVMGEGRIERPFIASLFLAMSAWAQQRPDAFLVFVHDHAGRDALLVQRLLAKGLVQCVDHAAGEVLDFLCADPRRLALGPYTDVHRDTKRLIQSLAPRLDSEQFQRLEQAILSWHRYSRFPKDDDAKTRLDRMRWDREHRLRLLCALPRELMSAVPRRVLEEEERAFPDLHDWDSRFSGVYVIESPVSAEQMAKATDEQVLNVFNELTDQSGDRHPRHERKGGARHAGMALAKLAESDVSRAVRLIRHLRPGTNEGPVGDVLRSLPKAGLIGQDLYALVEELLDRGFASPEFHRAVGHVLHDAACTEHPVPDILLERMETWLADAAPAAEDESGKNEREGSLLWGYGGLTILPAGNYPVLSALSQACLVTEPPRMDRWLGCLETHLARRETPKVWGALSLRYLQWLHLTDHARAQAFLGRLFSAYPSVLQQQEGVLFMAHLQRWISPENARAWLTDMVAMGGLAAQGAGEILLLRHARFPQEDWLRARVAEWLTGDQHATLPQRIGMAHSVAHLWSEPSCRELVHGYLLPLMTSPDDGVQKALGVLFRTQTLFPDQATWEWLDALYEHPALLQQHDTVFLLEHLERLLPAQPERVVRLCHVLLDQAGVAMGNVATSWYLSGDHLAAIALALQDMDEPHRSAGVTLFERQLEFNLPQAREMTVLLDKRTSNLPELPRPRRRTLRRGGATGSALPR